MRAVRVQQADELVHGVEHHPRELFALGLQRVGVAERDRADDVAGGGFEQVIHLGGGARVSRMFTAAT